MRDVGFWPIVCWRFKGKTYFNRNVWSINEGYFPCLYIRWRNNFWFRLVLSQDIQFMTKQNPN